MRACVGVLGLLITQAAHAADVCEDAWAKAMRIRAELGLEIVEMPANARFDPRACQAMVDMRDDDLRELIKEVNAICGEVCRNLSKPKPDGE